jgi:FkbM family methyltransferase
VVARYRWGGSREPELGVLPQLVNAGETVIDIGAHLGLYAYPLVKLVGATGSVHCFEPQPALAKYLRRALPSVIVHECALSSSRSTAELSIPVWGRHAVYGHASLDSHSGDGINLTVSTERLDDIEIKGKVTLIKCDVEGHEIDVLHGAINLLTEFRPTLILEMDERNPRTRSTGPALLSFLDDLGYGTTQSIPGSINKIFTVA